MTWQRIWGTVQPGHQVASGKAPNTQYAAGTIALQLPFFRALGLDLTPFFQGTLNVTIRPCTYVMHCPAYTFRQVQWTTQHPPEDFSFSSCYVIFQELRYRGMVYYPHPETKKTHFQDRSTLEILAPLIAGITYGERLELALNPAEIAINGVFPRS
ncbi:MAG: hypothetical protein KME16_23140 [Scytolyngbya sp. HA4215-MV1]|jgi:hypothetical protein|nr:hypothetical protein [Scytolyngbya sp. HA4215-MV1]